MWLRRAAVVLVLAAQACGCPSTKHQAEEARAAAERAAGKRLLQEYVDSVQVLASAGSADVPRELLEELRVKGEAQRTKGEVPAEFGRRYLRLLDATLALLQPEQGPDGTAQLQRKLDELAASVLGADAKVSAADGLAGAAEIFVEEFVNLRLLL